MFSFLWLFFAFFVFALAIAATALPPWLAYRRHCRDTALIALLSIFLGWSILGWIAALLWAIYGPANSSDESCAAASGLIETTPTISPRFLRRL